VRLSARRIAAILLLACASSVQSAGLAQEDAAFLQKAAQANAAEAKISQSAQTRAVDPTVKAFADRMVEDHTASNRKLEALAKRKGLSVATEPDSEHVMRIGSLQNLEGPAFDRAYAELMIEDHRALVQLYEAAARDAHDADVSRFARKTLPMLREHVRTVQAWPH